MVWWKSTYRAGAKCERCGADIARRKAPARFCLPCVERHQIDTGASAARKAVTAAVAAGTLPKASTQRCVDCGKPARDYDHRDYNKPLDVVPVCRSCNKLRGAAIPLISEVAEGLSGAFHHPRKFCRPSRTHRCKRSPSRVRLSRRPCGRRVLFFR